MVLAARSAPDGEVIQFLAGAPELLARYRNAPPAAAALIHAAMDARRLGMGAGLPQAFLEAAAPGYLTDAEWDALGEDWLEQALAYTAVPCKGARGPLTRIRPRPASRAARNRGDQPGSMAAAAGPLYRLADYLDQHGRAHRASQIPPAEFWSAAAAHAAPGDQAALGDAAHARGLYRDAAQLHKNAAASGNPRAAFYLSRSPGLPARGPPPRALGRRPRRPRRPGRRGRPAGQPAGGGRARAGRRAAGPRPAAHAALDDPAGVASLLDSLREAGAHEQAAALLARDPPPTPPSTTRRRGQPAGQPAGGGRARAGRRAGRPGRRPRRPRRPGRRGQAAGQPAGGGRARAGRRAGRPGRRPRRPRRPGRRGRAAGQPAGGGRARAGRRAAGPRPAAHAALDDPGAVASLLDSLREAGAHEQAAALAGRAAAHAPLDDPTAWPACWTACGRRARTSRPPRCWPATRRPRRPRRPGRRGQPAGQPAGGGRARAGRRAGRPGRRPRPPRRPGRRGQPAGQPAGGGRARAGRRAGRPAAAAHAALDDPGGVAVLLDSLREAGAHEQAAALLARDPPPTPPSTTRAAWPACWTACGRRARTSRPPRWPPGPPPTPPSTTRPPWPAAGQPAGGGRARAGRRAAGPRPGRPRRPRRPGRRGHLLDSLREAGAHEQAAALAARAAAHAPLDDPAAWPACWTACGRRARTSRPPRWPAGCRRPACSSSSSSRKASRISSVSDGRPTAPRPRHGAGKTWTYGLFPDRGDREATLPVGLPPTRRIRKVSLDSSLSGRPELHCEAQLSAPAPRSLHSDRTITSVHQQRPTHRVSVSAPLPPRS